MSGSFSGYCFHRRVAFADTDSMGVVHHVNYLRYFEEARVAWLRDRGLTHLHYPKADLCLAVIESGCRHRAGARFDEELTIYLQVRRLRLKFHFQYAILRTSDESELIALGKTILVPVNRQLEPIRPPLELTSQVEKETWTETWL